MILTLVNYFCGSKKCSIFATKLSQFHLMTKNKYKWTTISKRSCQFHKNISLVHIYATQLVHSQQAINFGPLNFAQFAYSGLAYFGHESEEYPKLCDLWNVVDSSPFNLVLTVSAFLVQTNIRKYA